MTRIDTFALPTLAICGEEDRLTPPKYSGSSVSDRRLARRRRAGLGHYVQVEQFRATPPHCVNSCILLPSVRNSPTLRRRLEQPMRVGREGHGMTTRRLVFGVSVGFVGNRARPVRGVPSSARPPSRPSANRSASTTTTSARGHGPNGQNPGLGDRRDGRPPHAIRQIVVTDDQGVRGARPAESDVQRVGARYGLVDSPKVRTAPGKIVNLKSVVARMLAAARNTIPGDLLVRDAPGSGQERVSRTGSAATASGDAEEPGPVAGRSSRPTDCYTCISWQQRRRARSEGFGPLHFLDRGVGAAHRLRDRHEPDDDTSAGSTLGGPWRCSPTGRSDRRRRAAGLQADAAPGDRAQRRHHPLGLGRPQGLSARRSVDRQAQPQVNANGLIYGATEESRDSSRCWTR